MRGLFVALSLLVAFGVAPAGAQDKEVRLKFATWVPPAHPLNPSLIAWGQDIEKETNGTVKSTLFPSEQLGKAFDYYDMTRDGITDFGFINPGYQPGRFPIIAAGELPFLIANAKGGSAAVDAWYRKYWDKEMRDVHVCFAFVLDPLAFHSRKKIVVPEDMRGIKMRPGNATMGAFVTLLGGTNVQVAAPEAREALERHVADAIAFPWGSILLFGIDKVVNYHMDLPVATATFIWAMNKGRYDALSAGQRGVIDRHCTTEWAEKIASPWADFEHAGLAKLQAMPGHDVYKITPEQTAMWRAAAAPQKVKWAAQVKAAGHDPDAVYAGLIAELKQRGALVD
jgi:TRAP-type C4-dicarboxylate transport system substrate-binding protein